MGKFTVPKLIEFFQSLEPAKSKLELSMLEQIYKEESAIPLEAKITHSQNNEGEGCCAGEHVQTDLNELEEKLKFNLFIAGDEMGEEDKKSFPIPNP